MFLLIAITTSCNPVFPCLFILLQNILYTLNMNVVFEIHKTIMLQVNRVLMANATMCTLFEKLFANDCLNNNIKALRKLDDIIAAIVCH